MRSVAGPIALGVVVILSALLFVKFAAGWLADTHDLASAAQRAEEMGRARTAALAILAGVLAAIGAYYTHRSFELNRRGQMTERFTRAVDQLGNTTSTDVRIGGIYALEGIAREAPEHHQAIFEILTTYVREHAPCPSEEQEELLADHMPEEYPRAPSADVQAALTAIGRRTVAFDPPYPWRLNLRGAYLPRVDLSGANLRRADLSFVVLDQAKLSTVVLEEADLVHARLRDTNLRGAHLVRARLDHANLSDAAMQFARLGSARLSEARLRRARLEGAFLQEADLSAANLERANLMRANMKQAILIEANLDHALLSGTDLGQARLEGANLRDSRYSSATRWPEETDPEQEGAIRVTD